MSKTLGYTLSGATIHPVASNPDAVLGGTFTATYDSAGALVGITNADLTLMYNGTELADFRQFTIVSSDGNIQTIRASDGQMTITLSFDTNGTALNMPQSTPFGAIPGSTLSVAGNTMSFAQGGILSETTLPDSGHDEHHHHGGSGEHCDPVCFCPGTLVDTREGPKAIETLAIDDQVLLADGATAPVRWIGRQVVQMAGRDPLRVNPVAIKAHALGPNSPDRDLFVSPCHAFLVDGILVQAGAMVNGQTIFSVPGGTAVTYFHVELADHALMRVQGTWAESFVDNVDRIAFDNYAPTSGQAPIVEMDLPRITAARQLPESLKARLGLLEKAEAFLLSA